MGMWTADEWHAIQWHAINALGRIQAQVTPKQSAARLREVALQAEIKSQKTIDEALDDIKRDMSALYECARGGAIDVELASALAKQSGALLLALQHEIQADRRESRP